jgi:hypothetical protein
MVIDDVLVVQTAGGKLAAYRILPRAAAGG